MGNFRMANMESTKGKTPPSQRDILAGIVDIPPYIIRDTREKQGWIWERSTSNFFSGTKVATLQSGDYSIEGHEKNIVVERKKTVMEIAANVINDAFERELERLDSFPQPFLVAEFDFDDIILYPENAKVSPYVKSKIKMKGPFIEKRIIELMLKYRTRWIFAGNRGKELTLGLFKRYLENVYRH